MNGKREGERRKKKDRERKEKKKPSREVPAIKNFCNISLLRIPQSRVPSHLYRFFTNISTAGDEESLTSVEKLYMYVIN